MNTTLRNLIGFTLLLAVVLAMACQCFADVTAVGAAYQDANGDTQLPANASIYFVDADAADDTADGRMGWSLSFTGGTYDHTGNGSGERLLTSTGAFSGYTDTGADGSDYIYVSNVSGGIATGYYRIDSKVSNDAVTLVADAGLTADGSCDADSGPKLTLAAGRALLANDTGDHLLLQSGDTWTDEEIGWVPNGADEDHMTLIGAYGTGARPEIASTSGQSCIRRIDVSAGYIAVIGLYMHPNNRAAGDKGQGVQFFMDDADGSILIEDNYIDGYLENLSFKATNGSTIKPDGLTVRRNFVLNARRASGQGDRALGLYVNHFSNMLIEDNVFDHNGWSVAVAGTTQDHNIYIADEVSSSIFRRNISSRSCFHGIKFDSDIGSHEIYDNFFSRNGASAQIGGGPSDNGPIAGWSPGLYTEVYNNCWVEASTEAGAGTGTGIEINNQKNGGYFRNNFLGNRENTSSVTVALAFQDAEDGVGYINYTIDSNVVYKQNGENRFLTPSEGEWSNCTVSNNHFQGPGQADARDLIMATTTALSGITFSNNTYYHGVGADTDTFNVDSSPITAASWTSTYEATATVSDLTSSYTAPTRNATSFATSKGYASYQAWIDDLVSKGPGDRDPTIGPEAARDYIFEGFDMDQFVPSRTKRVLILQ